MDFDADFDFAEFDDFGDDGEIGLEEFLDMDEDRDLLQQLEDFGQEEDFRFAYDPANVGIEFNEDEVEIEEGMLGMDPDVARWVYEYQSNEGRGGIENEDFVTKVRYMDMMRSGPIDQVSANDFYDLITSCPVGHSFPTPEYMIGRSLGEMVNIFYSIKGSRPDTLPGMFYRGRLTRFRVTRTRASRGVGEAMMGQTGIRAKSFLDVTVRDIPLDRIDPNSDLARRGFFGIREILDERARRPEEDVGQEGSDWNMLTIPDEEGFFVRRFSPYEELNETLETHLDRIYEPTSRFRPLHGLASGGRLSTGGFSELIPNTCSMMIDPLEGHTYELIIPGGAGNCLEECIIEFIARDRVRKGWRAEGARSWVECVRKTMKTNYIEERARTAISEGKEPRRSSYASEYEKKIRYGYSSDMVRTVQKTWCEKGYNIRVVYEREAVRGGRRPGRYMKCVEVSEKKYVKEENIDIIILRIKLDGTLHYKNYEVKDFNDATDIDTDVKNKCGNIIHAVTLFPDGDTPFIDVSGVWRKKKSFRLAVSNCVEENCVEFMKEMRDKALGAERRLNFDYFKELVGYQKERHGGGHTENLFFKKKQKYFFKSKPEFPLVIAYDIETVELTKEAILTGKVNLATIFNSENVDYTRYDPEARQIPFSVQWVPVNLSDEGEVLEKKLEKEETRESVIDYTWLGDPDWEDRQRVFKTAKDKKIVSYEAVMLDEVRTVYGYPHLGELLLGDAVHAFIEQVAQYAVDRGFTKKIYLYAHNGVSFDSFIIESFNTKYKVHSRLKTGRGILSLKIEYPFLNEYGKQQKLQLVFLDTRVFLSFSLARICKDFSVPKEWSKIDFPITRVNWKNCYKPEIMELTRDYGENDVRALAFIVKQINRMVSFPSKEVVRMGFEEWIPGEEPDLEMERDTIDSLFNEIQFLSLGNGKPPITQFTTFMSVVKKALNSYFTLLEDTTGEKHKPESIDVAALRYWIRKATMGGRTTAYAKGYQSSHWPDFLKCYMEDNKEGCANVVKEAIRTRRYKRVLDVTSLYPFAMAENDMPTGEIYACETEVCCKALVELIACSECETLMTLCARHRASNPEHERRPFGILIVEDVYSSRPDKIRHQVGRKTYNEKGGIIYSLETMTEICDRLGIDKSNAENLQAYTNVDLYWMQKQGFVVTRYVGGFYWNSQPSFSGLIKDGFKLRAKAKSEMNQCLQQTLKLFLNGIFGVESQKDIDTKEIFVTLPPELRHCHPEDPRLTAFVTKNYAKQVDTRFTIYDVEHLGNRQSILKLKITEGLGECLSGYSPNHVGAACLAWARHVVNLVLFRFEERLCTYTDTDSLAVFGITYDYLKAQPETVIDESGKILGLYKNDHADHFPPNTDPIVLFSAIGAKKVKLHVVANTEGDLYLANTYKGYLGQKTCPETGRVYSVDKILYEQTKALLEIFYFGFPSPHYGTRWSRDSTAGVRIEKNVLFSCDSSTYLNFCKGFTISEPPRDPKGFVSYVVPFGSEYGNYSNHDPVIKPVLQRDGKTWVLPKEWSEALEQRLQGVTFESMCLMIKKYYKKEHDLWYYSPQDEAEKLEYNRINETFDLYDD